MKAVIKSQLVPLGARHVLVPVKAVACAFHPISREYLKRLRAANDNNGGSPNVA